MSDRLPLLAPTRMTENDVDGQQGEGLRRLAEFPPSRQVREKTLGNPRLPEIRSGKRARRTCLRSAIGDGCFRLKKIANSRDKLGNNVYKLVDMYGS